MTGINHLCYKQGEGEGNVTNRGRSLIPLIPLNLLEILLCFKLLQNLSYPNNLSVT